MLDRNDLNRNLAHPIGVFFTPAQWAEWVLIKYKICEQWLAGATIFEPTAGTGIFLESLIKLAISQGITVTSEMLSRLWANEIQAQFRAEFMQRISQQYGLNFPEANFFNQDILFLNTNQKFDILLGNPPWQNFNELPTEYKQKLKPLFHQYGLVSNARDLLLGSSRIDIAALIIAKTIGEHLCTNGLAYFFMPLSVFFNEGASKGFRSYQVNLVNFCISEIYDFKNQAIFKDVSTRYGLVAFQRDRLQHFPIPYFICHQNNWQEYQALPLGDRNESLAILESAEQFQTLTNFQKIEVARTSKPRQGVNSCGAKEFFVFDHSEVVSCELVKVSNQRFQNILLPSKFLFPLITKASFTQSLPTPEKYILLPYNFVTAKPLLPSELTQYAELWQYLQLHQTTLENRKGILIQNWIKKGYWYALLGVGIYTFAPYKVVWQAYGQKTFYTKLFAGCWQGNQAMHAFMPVSTQAKGEELVAQLNNSLIEKYLHSQQVAGTCNWAQPSRIAKLLALTK